MKKRILIIFFKELKLNPRAIKQINALKSTYDITLAGYDNNGLFNNINFIKITPKFKSFNLFYKILSFFYLLFGLYNLAFLFFYNVFDVLSNLKTNKYDLIISHDLKPLKIIYHSNIIHKSIVLLDAHEYFLDVQNNLLNRLLFQRFENYFIKKHINTVDHIDTVNESISDLYKAITHKPTSYTFNVPFYQNFSAGEVSSHIRMIHHGFADPERKLELMIEVMQYLKEGYQLDFMLTNLGMSVKYIEKLKRKASALNNVRFISPVKPEEIIPFINQYDIGLYILPDDIMNMKYALPNKFFDFIQARLMIAIGPSYEMSKIVHQYKLGIVAPSFDSKIMAEQIKALTKEDIYQFKLNAHEAAKELCAEKQLAGLQNTIEHLLADNSKT